MMRHEDKDLNRLRQEEWMAKEKVEDLQAQIKEWEATHQARKQELAEALDEGAATYKVSNQVHEAENVLRALHEKLAQAKAERERRKRLADEREAEDLKADANAAREEARAFFASHDAALIEQAMESYEAVMAKMVIVNEKIQQANRALIRVGATQLPLIHDYSGMSWDDWAEGAIRAELRK
jgi:uncharacterized protein